MANNIFSTYYWQEENNERRGLVIDVALADYVAEDINKKLTLK